MSLFSVHCAKCRAWARGYGYFKFVPSTGRPICKDNEACKKRKKDGELEVKLDGPDKKRRRRKYRTIKGWRTPEEENNS